MIELHRQGQQIVLKELWSSNRLRLHHGNAMRIDDTLYFTSGGKGSPAILTAADVRTGEVRWQERSIGKRRSCGPTASSSPSINPAP